ncbi:hypothetical protein BX600DRAFT_435013 [Xylariales sp. PMI_506]|nr:hypothetical protein BX600DRAFT_435013 [Xylariales sp. PMI_506]
MSENDDTTAETIRRVSQRLDALAEEVRDLRQKTQQFTRRNSQCITTGRRPRSRTTPSARSKLLSTNLAAAVSARTRSQPSAGPSSDDSDIREVTPAALQQRQRLRPPRPRFRGSSLMLLSSSSSSATYGSPVQTHSAPPARDREGPHRSGDADTHPTSSAFSSSSSPLPSAICVRQATTDRSKKKKRRGFFGRMFRGSGVSLRHRHTREQSPSSVYLVLQPTHHGTVRLGGAANLGSERSGEPTSTPPRPITSLASSSSLSSLASSS